MRDQKLQSYYTSAQIDLIKDLESKNNKLIETKQIIKKTISKIQFIKYLVSLIMGVIPL